MRPSRSWRCADRAAQFEPFEPRLMMSADPAGDFYVDYFVEDRQPGEIRTMLADAHDLTGLSQARAEYGLTGSGQTVAVIDTGIAYNHVALGGGFGAGYRVVGGFDFSDERDNDPYDDGPYGSHGTPVAGIIGGDDAYYPGVAPGVDLVGLRVFDDAGQGHFSWVEEALAWVHNNRNAFDNPITTVNLSLGVDWNADSPPDWAMLEDDFARLEADGIFVAVSAGNGYVARQQVGLNYPAASPYVVPVGAVDDDGGLSYFSQRHPRMIAAPGRGVRSTVPDYKGDRNGIDDDYASYSGTSMAAPYVAGAAVLLREAYEFVGVGNVTQDTIYDLMVSSADTIVDPDSGISYYRLNIDRALDQIMPADDFGSSQSDAYQLGTLADAQTLAGTIGTLTDRDWFSFTAGATGSVRFDLIATGEWTPQWEMPAGLAPVPPAAGTFSLDVIAGQTYSLGLSTDNGLGHYTLELELEALPDNTDWGTVDRQSFDGYRLYGPGRDFTLAAASDGILTVEAFFRDAEGDVDLELYAVAPDSNGDGALLATSYGIADTERIDVTVSAGDTFRLRAYVYGDGSNDDVDFRVTNLVSQNGGLLHVGGTAGDDRFAFAAGAVHQITVNDTTYEFPSAAVDRVTFDGGAGNDSIALTGTAGDDRAVLRSGSAELIGSGYRAVVASVENVTIHGGGGNDRAVLYDSIGDDLFIARPQRSTMSGDGFRLEVHRFDRVLGHSINGGFDVAKLIDSDGDDLVVARPTYATMYGDTFYLRAMKFDRVHAYSINGGYDVAKLIDSAGDDRFRASPVQGILSGNDFYNRAKYFDEVHAYALNGGNDRAELADSAGDDVFTGTPISAALRGTVTGSNATFYNRAKFFEQLEATSTGGNDRATLQPSGNALLEASDRWARLSFDAMSQHLSGFNHVEVRASSSGTSTEQIAAHDFVLVREGVWQ